MSRTYKLRCLSYPGENCGESGYYAQCIDLDLLVWRPTFAEARAALDEQVQLYFDGVGSAEELAELFPRMAPLPDRLRYYVIWAMVNLVRGVRRFREWRLFDERFDLSRMTGAA